MDNFIRKLYWLLSSQFGIDLRRMLRSFKGIPRFLIDLIKFRKNYTGKLNLLPCLHDWYEEGGSTKNEYFLQDLYVAQQIHMVNPEKHVDVGSRIDGFVAHVASYREIEVFDIRQVTSSILRVIFRQADLMNPSNIFVDYCDSLSCLHALEHFGLGRYGDPLNALGYVAGFENIAKILKKNGLLYLSVPVGIERVEFNANRVFDPETIVKLAMLNDLSLKSFSFVGTTRTLTESRNPEVDMSQLSTQNYALGIFTFIKE